MLTTICVPGRPEIRYLSDTPNINIDWVTQAPTVPYKKFGLEMRKLTDLLGYDMFMMVNYWKLDLHIALDGINEEEKIDMLNFNQRYMPGLYIFIDHPEQDEDGKSKVMELIKKYKIPQANETFSYGRQPWAYNTNSRYQKVLISPTDQQPTSETYTYKGLHEIVIYLISLPMGSMFHKPFKSFIRGLKGATFKTKSEGKYF